MVAHVERLAERGNQLRMPASRALGKGLFELRIDLSRTARRITYYFASGPGRRIVLLTTFRKQRQNERAEINRAHDALAVASPKDTQLRRTTDDPEDNRAAEDTTVGSHVD